MEGDSVQKSQRTVWLIVMSLLITGILFVLGTVVFQPKGIPVLNYHEVQDNVNNPLALSIAEFDEQMAYLSKHGYHSITPDELLSYLQNDIPLPDKSVLITFDDGYRNNYINAYPILKKYGFTATIFLITDVVGHNDWYLDWEQVKEMQQAGFVFGSHTLSHVPLVALSNEEALFQLKKSKEGIEWRLGVPVEYFAYPTGAYNENTRQLVKQAGYKAAFSVDFGRVGKNSNIYSLERVPIFKSKLSFHDFYLRLKFTKLVEINKVIKSYLLH